MYKKVRETDPENETRELFRVFDAEGQGFIGEFYFLLPNVRLSLKTSSSWNNTNNKLGLSCAKLS